MSVPNVSLNDNTKVQNISTTVNKDTVVTNTFKSDNLGRQPQEDTFNGKSNKKILTYASIGTILASLVGIAIDFKFAEGKHVKKLWNKLTGHKPDVKTKANETPNIGNKVDTPEVTPSKSKVNIEPAPVVEPEKGPDIKIEKPKEVQINDDVVVPNATEAKVKTKPVPEPVTKKEYIDSETLSPVKEKWQGKTLLERTVKTEDGLVTTSYKNGKVESVFTNGDAYQQLEVYATNGRTVEETYFRTFGTLHIKKGNTELLIPHISEENFKEAVKLSQKYGEMNVQELDKIYREVLSDNPNKMSLFEFNILEAHLDELNLTVPKITEKTSIPKHGHYNAINYQIRRIMAGEEPLNIGIDKKMIENVNQRMAETLPPLEKDCIFYRGIGANNIPQIIEGKVGDIVVPDKGFAYTSWHKHYAEEYGDGTILIIHTPKGAKVSRCNANYGEALFPSGAEYRIISKSKTPADSIYPDGQWRIELEYILPKS